MVVALHHLMHWVTLAVQANLAYWA